MNLSKKIISICKKIQDRHVFSSIDAGELHLVFIVFSERIELINLGTIQKHPINYFFGEIRFAKSSFFPARGVIKI